MKTSAYDMRRLKKLAHKEKLRTRSLLGVAARERNRIARTATEPSRVEWRGRHEHTWTFCDRRSGTMHALDIYRGQRRDQYDVTVDGNPWKRGISATALATYVRRKLAPHICPES